MQLDTITCPFFGIESRAQRMLTELSFLKSQFSDLSARLSDDF